MSLLPRLWFLGCIQLLFPQWTQWYDELGPLCERFASHVMNVFEGHIYKHFGKCVQLGVGDFSKGLVTSLKSTFDRQRAPGQTGPVLNCQMPPSNRKPDSMHASEKMNFSLFSKTMNTSPNWGCIAWPHFLFLPAASGCGCNAMAQPHASAALLFSPWWAVLPMDL